MARVVPTPIPAESTSSVTYLILFKEDAVGAGRNLLRIRSGVKLQSTANAPDGRIPPDSLGEHGLLFSTLGAAAVRLTFDQVARLGDPDSNSPIQLIRQEGVMTLFGTPPEKTVLTANYLRGYRDGIDQTLARVSPGQTPTPTSTSGGMTIDYMLGYRDGVSQVVDSLLPRLEHPVESTTVAPSRTLVDESHTTWGLQATKAADSELRGRGVRVAILDTGLAADHPDFPSGRVEHQASFVLGEDSVDHHGHGTHCTGVVCGPESPTTPGPRYGVAPEALVAAGKVIGQRGEGREECVLAGINWALSHASRIILLPFGMAPRGPRPQEFWAAISRRALARDALLIAAAGGHSNRTLGNIQPVAVPANGGDVVGVGAVGPDLDLASFSNCGVLPAPGSVDVVAPGVNVQSAWVPKLNRRSISGTSVSAAYTAGVAALIAEGLGKKASASAILNRLLLTAKSLPYPSSDAGKGLIQAPKGPLS